jgi:hypothetical protein
VIAGGPGFAAEGSPIIKATLKKLKGTLDFNIVLIFSKNNAGPRFGFYKTNDKSQEYWRDHQPSVGTDIQGFSFAEGRD